MRPGYWAVVAFALTAGLAADYASAQYNSNRASFSRPSSYAPSESIGGYFTRGQAFSTLQSTQRDVALLGQETFQFSRRNRTSRRPQGLNVTQLGMFNTLSAPRGVPLSNALGRTGEVNLLHELGPSPSLVLDLTPFGGGRLPAINSFVYTPTLPQSPFQEAFGLTPSQAESSGKRIKSVADELEQHTAGVARRSMEGGLELFREATVERLDPRTNTYPNCPDCVEKLAGAIAEFTTVRDLDGQNWLAPLLLAHAAMEQEKPTVAFVELAEAFRRKPDLFSGDPVDLSQHFGDASGGRSSYLAAQMQRYLRVGDLNPTSPEAQLLQAYCAWQLGDRPRAVEAAELAGRLAQPATVEDMRLRDEVVMMAGAIRSAAP